MGRISYTSLFVSLFCFTGSDSEPRFNTIPQMFDREVASDIRMLLRYIFALRQRIRLRRLVALLSSTRVCSLFLFSALVCSFRAFEEWLICFDSERKLSSL